MLNFYFFVSAWLIFWLYQSLLLVVVGFTFSDDQVPEGFEVHWGDWLGESADSVEDWQSGPFHEHLPPQKGMVCGLVQCWNKKKKRWNGTILFMFWIEEVIHKSVKILPASFVTTLLETFSSNFWKRGKCSMPMKACELGSEVSWLPLLCIQKGVQYEGFMRKPELLPVIETDLLQSTFF